MGTRDFSNMTLGSCFDFLFDILIRTQVFHSLIDTARISHCYFRLYECLDQRHHTHIYNRKELLYVIFSGIRIKETTEVRHFRITLSILVSNLVKRHFINLTALLNLFGKFLPCEVGFHLSFCVP